MVVKGRKGIFDCLFAISGPFDSVLPRSGQVWDFGNYFLIILFFVAEFLIIWYNNSFFWKRVSLPFDYP